MTGRWLTVSRTITRIWAETGRLLTGDDVLRLGRRTGPWGLIVETSHEHTRVLERSVDEHVAWLKAPAVTVLPLNTTQTNTRKSKGGRA